MKFRCLAIDTTAECLTVILTLNDRVCSRRIETGKSGHSRLLLGTIDDVLKEGAIAIPDLDAIAVVVGPGSFTGIRIGVSMVTAMCYATGVKRIAVNSFELIAYNREIVTVAIDAGHKNLYLANCERGKVISTSFLSAEDTAKTDTSSFINFPLSDVVSTLAEVVCAKAENGEFVQVLEPFYMRKSQAERAKDEI